MQKRLPKTISPRVSSRVLAYLVSLLGTSAVLMIWLKTSFASTLPIAYSLPMATYTWTHLHLHWGTSFSGWCLDVMKTVELWFIICRWAVKQEDFLNMGQWKNSTISNPEWNKRALSWPVYEDGTWNSVRLQFYSHQLLKKKFKNHRTWLLLYILIS